MCIRVSSSSLGRVALVLSPHACLLSYGLVLPRARGERLMLHVWCERVVALGRELSNIDTAIVGRKADAMFPRNNVPPHRPVTVSS